MLAGIDLGGTQVRVALARSDGRLIASFKTKTPLLRTPERMVEWAAEEIERHRRREKVTSITIAAPGPIDIKKGVLVNPPDRPGWRNVPLADLLRRPRARGGRASRPLHGPRAHQPHERARPRAVRDGRRRDAVVGIGPAHDARYAQVLTVHQAGPPAPPAARPAGRQSRSGGSRGMGTNQPVADQDVLRLLKQAAADEGATAWIVGGYVRDKLLGRPHPDPDVVVEHGSAPTLAQRFAELAGAPPPVIFERFGTAQVTVPGHIVEFVSARAESYPPDSRKPVVRSASLEEDIKRRDFTINTLLMDFDGNISDPVGRGRADLAAKVLRTPVDPAQTFSDDPLRMLRGVRFAAQLGFEPAPDIPPAMRAMKGRLVQPVISAERIADELRKILESERPRRAIELLDEGGLLE